MTASPTWPDHLLGLEEWAALPEDSDRRIELAEGVLVVSPRPLSRHQKLILLLAAQLHAGATGRWETRPEYEVLSVGTCRRDRVTKPDEYAEAGVRWYLLVEPGPPAELTELELVDGAYVTRARHRGSAPLRRGVTLDLDG